MAHKLPFPKNAIPKGGEFGNKDVPRTNPHRGTDFSKGIAKNRDKIPSASDGKVTMSKWSDVLGNIVVVKDELGYYWGYCHLFEPGLKVGTVVKCGDTVGLVGNTGSASRGAHLHWTCSKEPNGVIVGKVLDGVAVIEKLAKAAVKPKEEAAPAVAPAAVVADAAPSVSAPAEKSAPAKK